MSEKKYIGERLTARADKYYGLKEVTGSQSNVELLDLIKSVVPWADDDSTISWCAIFMTYLFREEGLSNLIPDKPLAARSWLNLEGEVIWERGMDVWDIAKLARPGDIVIFWRYSIDDWRGHIGFYMNEYHYDKTKIRIKGGNQSDGVLIRSYSKHRVLKIIRL